MNDSEARRYKKNRTVNSWLILLVSSVATDSPFVFQIARRNLGALVETHEIPESMTHMKFRTDSTMRKLLEFALQASIVTGNEFMCGEVLKYARNNTMLC